MNDSINTKKSLKNSKKKPYGQIYKITNRINNKVYIGKTITTLKRRWQKHLTVANLGRRNTFLIQAINKYGEKNFIIETLGYYDDETSLNEAEKFFIEEYKSNAFRYSKGYNMTDGGEAFKIFKGEDHPQFTPIDTEKIKKFVKKGCTVKEIAKNLNVGHTVIQNRIYEMGYKNMEEARKNLGGLEKWKQKRRKRMSESAKGKIISEKTKKLRSNNAKGSNNPRYVAIEKDQIIDAIKKAGGKKGGKFTLVDVGNELRISNNTAMKKIRNILGINFPKTKNIFYFEPKIKALIQMGKTPKQISQDLSYADQSWANNKIRELWGLSYKEAKRLFRSYPKINKKLLEILYSEGLMFAEIDKRFLIKLVLNYSVHEIAKKLEIGKDYLYTLIRNILGFNNLKQARAELSSKYITK